MLSTLEVGSSCHAVNSQVCLHRLGLRGGAVATPVAVALVATSPQDPKQSIIP